MSKSIVIIAHNLRSAHNVGSLLRTADALGVQFVYLTGYTPYPSMAGDQRLPHEAARVSRLITKTALGAEHSQPWRHHSDIGTALGEFRQAGYQIIALEQAPNSRKLPDFTVPDKIAILVGREVEGLEKEVLSMADTIVEIPMLGQKESLNVVQAAAMALYHCRFMS